MSGSSADSTASSIPHTTSTPALSTWTRLPAMRAARWHIHRTSRFSSRSTSARATAHCSTMSTTGATSAPSSSSTMRLRPMIRRHRIMPATAFSCVTATPWYGAAGFPACLQPTMRFASKSRPPPRPAAASSRWSGTNSCSTSMDQRRRGSLSRLRAPTPAGPPCWCAPAMPTSLRSWLPTSGHSPVRRASVSSQRHPFASARFINSSTGPPIRRSQA
jgi:hypothetical protein